MKKIINVSNRLVILGNSTILPKQKLELNDDIDASILKRIKQLESMRIINVYNEENKIEKPKENKNIKKESSKKSNKKETKV